MRFFLLCSFVFQCLVLFAADRYLVINPNGHRGTIKSMCLDSKGKVITAGYDKTIKIWNSREGYLEREIHGFIGPGDEGVIHAIAISPDDKYLAVAGWFGNTDGTEAVGDIRIFNYKTGTLVKLLKSHVGPAFDLQFMGGSDYLASAGQTGELYLWEVNSDNVWHADKVPTDITDLERFDDHYYTSHRSGVVYKWESNFQKPIATYKKLEKQGRPASELAVSPNGERLAVASGGDVFILNGALKEIYTFNHGEDVVSMMNFSPNSTRLIVASSSVYLIGNHVRVYEEIDEQWFRLSAYMKHMDGIGCAQFIDNSTCVTAGGADNEVVIWKVEESKKYSTVLHFLSGVGKPIHSAGINGDKIGFATTWKKNDGLTPYTFTFDLTQRLVRAYDSTDACAYPTQTYGDYKVLRPSSLRSLTIKKGDVTKAAIYRDNTNGIFHLAYTFVEDRYLVSGGAYGYLEVYDLEGNKISTLVGHDGDLRALAVSDDKRFLVSGGSDQTIRLWRIEDFANNAQVFPVVSLFAATNGEWVLWNEDGYFMSSKKGASYVGYHINQGKDEAAKYYPFEQFDIQYNRPDIIMNDLGIVEQGIIDLYHAAYLKRLKRMNMEESSFTSAMNAPIVKLTTLPSTKDKGIIKIEASDSVQFLKTINVYLNDVPVFGRNGLAVNENQKKISQQVDLDLMAGINKIQVSVVNVAGVESLKETITLTNTVETQSSLYVVALGVSNYKDTTYNLEYAAKDAQDVDALFGQSDYFKNVYHKLLTDEQVTKANIAGLKDFVAQASRNDVVLFFIAGHGVLNKTLDYYYCTYDMDFRIPEKNGVAYAEMESLFDGIKAIRKLLIMDTCHSGEVDKDDVEEIAFVNTENEDISFRNTNTTTTLREVHGLEQTNEAVKEMFNDLRRGTGATVISSAGGAEYAMESDEWKNGLFTYCLLEGIKSKNADANKDGAIMLSELQNYISVKVAELSKGRQMPTSRFENLALDYRVW